MSDNSYPEPMRIGLGVDLHRLAEDEDLILGGVHIDYQLGTVAHSDGDVLIHAICDALLGALNLGDLGTRFPDDDPQYRGISSVVLLERVLDSTKSRDFTVGNVDSTLILERPKIEPYSSKMSTRLEDVLEAPVSIKATTPEGLTFIGSENGIAAQSVALLRQT